MSQNQPASADQSTLDAVRGSRSLAYAVGGITLGAGLILMFWPDRTISVIARIAGLLLLIVGAADLVGTIRSHKGQPYWGILLVRAIFHVGYGLALLVWPNITVTVVVWLFGLDMLITALLGFLVMGKLPPELRPSMIMSSVLTGIFGIVILVWPSATLTVLAFTIAALLIGFGLVLLWSGRQLSKLASAV